MKKSEFFEKFLEFLEIESINSINEETILKDLDEYDSFFILTIVAFVDDNFSINLTSKQLNDVDTMEDLMQLIGNEKFID